MVNSFQPTMLKIHQVGVHGQFQELQVAMKILLPIISNTHLVMLEHIKELAMALTEVGLRIGISEHLHLH